VAVTKKLKTRLLLIVMDALADLI